MRVLLLSAYAAASHLHWQRSLLAMFPDWQWRVLTLPPRHFSWRIRGNPLYWSQAERETLECPCDLVLATSMVDLATLRGLVPALSATRTVLYFHENQFAYPQGRGKHNPVEAQMVSLYSALAADTVVFNSTYNSDTFFAGCTALLAKLPDKVPGGIVGQLRAKSTTLPVPYDQGEPAQDEDVVPGSTLLPWSAPERYPQRPLRLLWVGRFEYDKGAGGLLALLHCLEQQGIDYELALLGQQFRDSPSEFQRIEEQFHHRLVQFGYLSAKSSLYLLMSRADLVISTALHEFQGLAVLEAVARGCLPVVPDRLAYREIYPDDFRYTASPELPDEEARSATELIAALARRLLAGTVAAPDISAYRCRALREHYRQLLQVAQ